MGFSDSSRADSARRQRFFASAGLAALCAGLCVPAQGQELDDQASASDAGSAIIVTGSRIRGVQPVGSPVIGVDRAAVEASQSVSVDKLIQETPQVFDLGVSQGSRAQSGGAGNIAYGTAINLRGIGPYATLVLLDGHRVISNSQFVDPSFIPTLALERVEIIADGASAIYGSDAVAGVVNLIPRRNIEGVETFARYGFGDEYHQYSIGAAAGHNWGSGQLSVSFQRDFQSNLSGDDRDFYRADQRDMGGNDYRIQLCNPGNIVIGGVTYAIPEGGLTPANAASLQPGTLNRCDTTPGQDLLPEQKYTSVFATFDQEITDGISIFADAFWNKRDFVRQPSRTTAQLNVPSTNAFYVNPTGVTATSQRVDYLFPNLQNTQYGYLETYEGTFGVKARLFGDFEAQGLITYGENHQDSITRDGLSTALLNAALASSDPDEAFNPYGANSQALVDSIANQIFWVVITNKLVAYELGVNGTLFSLPGGDVRIAAGYDAQEHSGESLAAIGAPTTPLTGIPLSRRVDSFYGEVFLPIFGSSNAVPGFERLELTAALRHDRYDDVGTTTNPKFGLNWSPVQGLMFRGSYGTSFRAPNFRDLYGNGTTTLYTQQRRDPEQGNALIQAVVSSGPNPNLKPETAETITIGADWEATRNLRLSLTYFDIAYDGQVAQFLSDTTVLALEDELASAPIIFRGQEARDRVAALIASGARIAGTLPVDYDVYVDGANFNLGRSVTQGIDFQADYRLETDNAGLFSFNLGGTYFTKYESAQTPTGQLVDRLNTIFNPLKFKARASVTWDKGPFQARMTVNHLGGYSNNRLTPAEDVSAFTTVDLGFQLRIGDKDDENILTRGFTLGVEARNLFDTDPPYVNIAPDINGSGGYDATAASPLGRIISATVRKSF